MLATILPTQFQVLGHSSTHNKHIRFTHTCPSVRLSLKHKCSGEHIGTSNLWNVLLYPDTMLRTILKCKKSSRSWLMLGATF
jgi:hypothetical protein